MDNISIIMTTYNGEKYLEEQLVSILSSTYKDFELYIIDDGSQDNTMEILERYKEKYPDKLHVSRNETNLGVTLNFLTAVSKTTSEYIMLCDQDDVWKVDKIAKTLKRVKQMEVQFGKELPIAVFTDAYVVDESLNIIHESFFRSGRLNPRLTDLPHLLMENKLIGCTVMVNQAVRRILQSSPLPKRARFHDGWLGLIAASVGKVGFIKEPTLFYRQHGANVVGNRGFISYFFNRIGNIRKQKRALSELYMQAEEFAFLYHNLIDGRKLDIISRFSKLGKENFIKRRITILRYGYLKSGIIRNIGLMFIV
ncbi:MAG: glycosyltransferase family 2 protein [Clostridiales bacterium]|jgi:glycosyltransferase involved in cell wall biosynthesis|nr:glycosyltransferase family 2 protein [Clostridiales bacterium]